MMRLRHALPVLALMLLSASAFAQRAPDWNVKSLDPTNGVVQWDPGTGVVRGSNGVFFQYAGNVMTADQMEVDPRTGKVTADGNVRYQKDAQIWTGNHIVYDVKTSQIESKEFRSGQAPVYMAGEGLKGNYTNHFYTATNAMITTDDIQNPTMKVRARSITIIPGVRVVARHATVYVGNVPIFYFPYYSHPLGQQGNSFNFVPGYRTVYGPFLLSSYNWFLNDELDGALHLDLRERRGVGAGPDFNYHLGRWGDGSLKYYYTYDRDPNASLTNDLPNNRQRLYFSYLANPATNFSVRSQVRYQSDLGIIHDFFETEYRQNPQPDTYIEANKFWDNFSLDLYAQPRVNDFYETVERLPDVRLTGWRQQIFDTPLYYESQTSAGFYERLFAETNAFAQGLRYEAARADTFHQVLLPETFFGWLNFTPRVGGRFTYYSDASGPGAMTDEVTREVFNTGAELSFKASQAWPGVKNSFFDVDGIRHIFQPSIDYTYVPSPNARGTNTIPQFDYDLPSLRLLPIDFPDYNNIDSIDSENVVRLGMRNKIQTKRDGQVVNLVDWNLYTDWFLQRRHDQYNFDDLYSDLIFRPESWLTFESVLRYDLEDGLVRLSLSTLTFKPQENWSWTLGQFYLRDDLSGSPLSLGLGNNLFLSTFYYKINENWGLRLSHRFEAEDGRLEEQDYTVYRDLRSWTAALTFRIRDNVGGEPDDVGFAFTFSLKALPRFGLGSDTVHPSLLLGS